MLRYRADLRTLAFMATYFGLTAALWVGAGPLSLDAARAWGAPQWAAGVALFALASFFSFFCAVATHNTVHSPVFKSRAHNRIFQAVLTLTYGHPVSAFVPGHNLSHHKHTQTPRDVMRTTKVRFRWHLLNGLFFMLSVAPAIMKGESRYFAAMKTRMPAWFRQLRVEQITLYAVYAVLLYLDWKKFLLFVFIPHKYAASRSVRCPAAPVRSQRRSRQRPARRALLVRRTRPGRRSPPRMPSAWPRRRHRRCRSESG